MAVPITAAGEWEHRDFFPPGPQLALVLSQSAESIPADAELLVAARAARRQMAWAAARQLAMLAALSERRHAEAAADPRVPSHRILDVSESLIEEIALGLGVTSNTAATLLNMADRLASDLPAMRRLLEAGQISTDHVRILCDALVGLPPALIPLLETAVAPDAPDLTTGQFRHRVKAALRALDPDTFDERVKATSKRQRRLEKWDNASGTTDLALCDLPAEQAHAIYNRISAVAQAMRTDGDTRTLDQLRADLATALLHGTTLPTAAQNLRTTSEPTPDTTRSEPDITPGAALCAAPNPTPTPTLAATSATVLDSSRTDVPGTKPTLPDGSKNQPGQLPNAPVTALAPGTTTTSPSVRATNQFGAEIPPADITPSSPGILITPADGSHTNQPSPELTGGTTSPSGAMHAASGGGPSPPGPSAASSWA